MLTSTSVPCSVLMVAVSGSASSFACSPLFSSSVESKSSSDFATASCASCTSSGVSVISAAAGSAFSSSLLFPLARKNTAAAMITATSPMTEGNSTLCTNRSVLSSSSSSKVSSSSYAVSSGRSYSSSSRSTNSRSSSLCDFTTHLSCIFLYFPVFSWFFPFVYKYRLLFIRSSPKAPDKTHNNPFCSPS